MPLYVSGHLSSVQVPGALRWIPVPSPSSQSHKLETYCWQSCLRQHLCICKCAAIICCVQAGLVTAIDSCTSPWKVWPECACKAETAAGVPHTSTPPRACCLVTVHKALSPPITSAFKSHESDVCDSLAEHVFCHRPTMFLQVNSSTQATCVELCVLGQRVLRHLHLLVSRSPATAKGTCCYGPFRFDQCMAR